VTGIAFDAALGLRSALFSLRIDTGEAPPPPPPADDVALQAPPEEAAALAATEVAGPTDAVRSGTEATGGYAASALPPELLVVATWLITAVAGAAALAVTSLRARRFGHEPVQATEKRPKPVSARRVSVTNPFRRRRNDRNL
jgi:hypothetical protein